VQVFLQASSENLLRRFETKEIEMIQRQPPVGVFVNQCERGRMDARRYAQASRQTFNKLRLARTEFARKADSPPALSFASPTFAEHFGFARAVRNQSRHGASARLREDGLRGGIHDNLARFAMGILAIVRAVDSRVKEMPLTSMFDELVVCVNSVAVW
jgi:hypothetical protein